MPKSKLKNSPLGPKNLEYYYSNKLAVFFNEDEPQMNLGTDGMQAHVQGSATPADLFKRTTAGSLRKWYDRFTKKMKPEWGCVMECKCCKPTSAP